MKSLLDLRDTDPRFKLIAVDPPWPYNSRNAIPAQSGTPSFNYEKEYATYGPGNTGYQFMSMEDLLAMPVGELADPNEAHLMLWCTNGLIQEAYQLCAAWGFYWKTLLTWGKVKQSDPTVPSMKCGWYFRGATEFILFATRGKLRPLVTRPTLFLSERLPHSVKPDWFYSLCEDINPGPYLELFARRCRPG